LLLAGQLKSKNQFTDGQIGSALGFNLQKKVHFLFIIITSRKLVRKYKLLKSSLVDTALVAQLK
jgi:hypothetical protein